MVRIVLYVKMHIGGGERLAIVPLHTLAQVEGVREPILRNVPRFGKRRLDLVPGRRAENETVVDAALQVKRAEWCGCRSG